MMKRKYKWLSAAVLATSLITTVGISFAADSSIGSTKAAADKDYTLKEILTYAIQDEYMAQAEYKAIMDKYGVQKPFSNIIRSEATHINLVSPLLKDYNVAVPENDAAERVVVPASLEESYTAGVEAEKNNIAMYERFLKEDLPDDVKAVLERLLANSKNHLAAFEKAAAGDLGFGMGKGKSNENRGHGGMNFSGSNGMGNGSGDCLMQ